MKLPILYDNITGNMGDYLSFVPKCVTSYTDYSSSGSSNNTNHPFRYVYSSDSLQLVTDNQIIPVSKVYYHFSKVQR